MLTAVCKNGAMELHRSVLGRQVGHSKGAAYHPFAEGKAFIACIVTTSASRTAYEMH